MFLPLDGPALYGAITATSTPIEVKVGASNMEDRSVVTIQPLDGDVYFGYSNSVTTSNGSLIYKGQFFPFEAGKFLSIWIISASGSPVDVRITEVG